MFRFFFYFYFVICTKEDKNISSRNNYIKANTGKPIIIDAPEEDIIGRRSCFNRICLSTPKLEIVFSCILVFFFLVMLRLYFSIFYKTKVDNYLAANQDFTIQ